MKNKKQMPFIRLLKTDIKRIFHEAFLLTGISLEEAHRTSSHDILKWFEYLINFFMPTLPIWSKLLLGINTV